MLARLQPTQMMRNLAVLTARRLVAAAPGTLEELWVRSFADDVKAHDDDLQSQFVQDFLSEFEVGRAELTREFGQPTYDGNDECDIIPLGGVFRYSVWKIDRRRLYLFAAHEDRELPFLLMLGTAELD